MYCTEEHEAFGLTIKFYRSRLAMADGRYAGKRCTHIFDAVEAHGDV